jgi:hypothetical protein
VLSADEKRGKASCERTFNYSACSIGFSNQQKLFESPELAADEHLQWQQSLWQRMPLATGRTKDTTFS